MSNARIIEIPATRQIRSGKNNTMRKMRVAAYCRVSTEEEEQQGSFETQKLYYTEKINSTSEWELAGIYADDGISGIHTKKRDGFNQMIQDCKKKKIDLILTKSISRFARNTLDSIQYVRMLKAIGIAVIFEKENINTSTMNSEMILTVLSAFAQAESESISQNVARGKRMGFRQGKFPFPYGQILGYRKGLDGKPEVIREEIFLMPDETPIDLLRILIWYDWEHEGVLQLATSRTANTPPGKTVSPIIYSEQLPLNRLLLDWADQKHSLSVRKITRADYLEWMLQWPPRLP